MRTKTSTAPHEDPPTEQTAAVETTDVPGARAPRRRRAAEPSEPSAAQEEPAAPVDEGFAEPPPEQPAGGVADDVPRPSATELRVGQGFDAIIDTIFEYDAEESFARTKRALKLAVKPSQADYGILVNALDEAAEHSAEALQSAANAAVAREAYEAEASALEAAMREEATAALKASGDKITLDAVQARMMVMFHDEMRELRERRAKVKRMVEYLEGLAGVLKERQRDLRQMVSGATRA